MLALIKDGEIISTVSEGGRLNLDGKVIMPALEGDLQDNYELKKVQPADPIPEGKIATGSTVEMVDGEPKLVYHLENIEKPLTAADVDAERDLRIASGFIFNGVRYQSRPEDRENIIGASVAALAYLSSQSQPEEIIEDEVEEDEDNTPVENEEDEQERHEVEETSIFRWHGGDTDFTWIAEDNSLTPMDAQTMFAFGQAAMAHKQALIFAARALKDLPEIPEDYKDDKYWGG